MGTLISILALGMEELPNLSFIFWTYCFARQFSRLGFLGCNSKYKIIPLVVVA